MLDRKKEMLSYMVHFQNLPDRLLKYNEILLKREEASPECYQDTMSYRRLAIALTTRCNLSCRWCYRRDTQYADILNKDMDFELYRLFVQNTKGKFRMVHLTGLGEVTLYQRLIDAIKLSKKLSKNIKITSNGVLLTYEKITNYIKAGLTHIEISIDAFDKKKLLEYRNVDLDHLCDIVSYISNETSLHLQINSVVSTENYKWLKGMPTIFNNAKNIKVWHTIPLFSTEQMRKEGITSLSNENYRMLLLDLEKEIKKKRLNWQLSPTAYGVEMDPVIEMKKKLNICFSCFEDPYININGRFSYCSRQESNAGPTILDGFEKIWNNPSLLEFRGNMLKGIYPSHCGKLCYLKEKT